MAITLTTAQKNDLLDTLWDSVDDGAGPGTVDITDASDVVLATLILSDPAFAAASGGTKTLNAVTSDTDAAAAGTAAKCKFYDSDSTLIASGTVGLSGADVNLDDLDIEAGGTVSITSGTASIP